MLNQKLTPILSAAALLSSSYVKKGVTAIQLKAITQPKQALLVEETLLQISKDHDELDFDKGFVDVDDTDTVIDQVATETA